MMTCQTLKEHWLARVSEFGWFLHEAGTLKADKEVVIAAVEHCGRALRYASDTLRADKKVVLAAITNDGYALEYASESLKADKEVVIAAVEHCGRALRYASDTLRADKKVVLAAINNDGYALAYASESLGGDRDIVLAAVKIGNVNALSYACDSLRSDKEVVLIAVGHHRLAMDYASESLQADIDVQLVNARHGPGAGYAINVVRALSRMIAKGDESKWWPQVEGANKLLAAFPVTDTSPNANRLLYNVVDELTQRVARPSALDMSAELASALGGKSAPR